MSQFTLGEVFDAARSHLADDQDDVIGGEVYTDHKLLPHAQMAVRDLFRALRSVQNTRIRKTVFYILPANTSVLVPSTASISDLVEPLELAERGGLDDKSITGATAGASYVDLTIATHGWSAGDQITVNGIGGLSGTEGMWGVAIPDGNTVRLNGCVATGTYTSATGVAAKSSETFLPMDCRIRITEQQSMNSRLSIWAFEGGSFRFRPANEERQLRIVYESTATIPESSLDAIPIDDGLDFVAIRTAALASRFRAPSLSRVLNVEALGPAMQTDASGGMLRDLLNSSVRAMQRLLVEERQRGSFREAADIDNIL